MVSSSGPRMTAARWSGLSGVGVDVGNDEDPLVGEGGVGLWRRRSVGSLQHDAGLDAGGVLLGDLVLEGGGNEDVAGQLDRRAGVGQGGGAAAPAPKLTYAPLSDPWGRGPRPVGRGPRGPYNPPGLARAVVRNRHSTVRRKDVVGRAALGGTKSRLRAGRERRQPQRGEGDGLDGDVLRRLIQAAGGGVRVRDLAGRTGMATAVRGGLAVVSYPDGVERLDPAQLAWAGLPVRTDSDPAA